MYLWNVKKLVDDLKAGRVGESEQFKYYLTDSFLTVLFMELLSYDFAPNNSWKIIDSILAVTFTIVSVWVWYYANRKGDNKDFIVRTMCLGVPIGIRIVVYAIFVGIVFEILKKIFTGTGLGDIQGPSDIGMSIGIWLVLTIWMRRCLIKISGNS